MPIPFGLEWTVVMQTSDRWRRHVSLGLVWWVPVAIAVTAVVWSPVLPAEIPTKWGLEGGHQFVPVWLLAAGMVALSAAACSFATASILRGRSRQSIWVPAGIAAVFAGTWVILALTTLTGNAATGPAPWAITVVLLLTYGIIPAMITPPRADTAR